VGPAEQRRAARIACDTPMRVRLHGAWRPATLVDVSRTGVRLRVGLAALGLDAESSAAQGILEWASALPSRVPVEFNPERLGSLVCREVVVVRLRLPSPGEDFVEIGGALDRGLSEVEAAALGLAIPLQASPAPSDRPTQGRA